MPKIISKLEPLHGPFFVTCSNVEVINHCNVQEGNVGGKAYGLSCLPKLWTLPYIVISSDLYESFSRAKPSHRTELVESWNNNLRKAAVQAGIALGDSIIIRSSACDEMLRSKGEYYSFPGNLSDLLAPLNKCLQQLADDPDLKSHTIPLILQKKPSIISAKGHLSNERRFSKEKRDWVIAYEEPEHFSDKYDAIRIRKWRKDITREVDPSDILACTNFSDITDRLKEPSAWAQKFNIRIHFEWVWDGYCVYLVQADEELDSIGINPAALKLKNKSALASFAPQVLALVDPSQTTIYNKIYNIQQYSELGLPTTKFYILRDQQLIQQLANGDPSEGLKQDISYLTQASLVVRMDIISNDKRVRQLLPRTNEVRSLDAAIGWFVEQRDEINKLLEYDLALIFHNFIPATSSAFAYAAPRERKVKIEALWGLPEGLYYFSHDKYIIDTGNSTLSSISSEHYTKFSVEIMENYKKLFVAPNDNGEWITQEVAPSHGWGGTIKNQLSLAHIAHVTRQIAEKENQAVSVMWFIGVDEAISRNRLLPWYHEPAEANPRLTRISYKPKTLFDKGLIINTAEDLLRLESEARNPSTVRFIRIQPKEDKLLRDKKILRRIGELSQKINAVIYLEGGTLSHAFYQLEKTGAQVQIAHSFESKEEKREYNKLVRDKIPSNIERRGEIVKTTKFSGSDLLRLLKEKLVEEAFEVLDAKDKDAIIEELADVNEIIDGILAAVGSNRIDLSQQQSIKAEKAGGFSEGYVLLETDNPLPKELKKNIDGEKLGIYPPTASLNSININFHDVIEKNHAIKKWFDRRVHKPEIEALFDLVVPVVKDAWEEKTPETFLTISSNCVVRAKVTGKRNGAKLKIRFSIYTLPRQLKLNVN